ncbi:MAG TPA: hypothetical protein PLE32_06285, partial [Haliscomenobacter sp.]|nr:hypothetical protein [Haliscomenobacter sp.]
MSLLIMAAWLFSFNVTTAQSNLTCGCYNVNVTLDENCQFDLTSDLVADGLSCLISTFRVPATGFPFVLYSNAYVRVMDNDLSGDPGRIDCAGVWTYGLFDRKGTVDTKDDVVICWGKVTAEDKTAPRLVCAPADITLDCYDVNYVMNNRLTIGNVGSPQTPTTSSPRPSATATDGRTITNAEGVAGVGDNCQLGLAPPSLLSDAVRNLGYAY